MNQILCISQTDNDNQVDNLEMYKPTAKKIKLFMFFIILLILIAVSSYKIYAYVTTITKQEIVVCEGNKLLINVISNGLITQLEQLAKQNLGLSEEITGENSNNSIEHIEQDIQNYQTSNGENYTVIGDLNIPSLGIKYPILSSTSKELLKISLNKYWGCNPNEIGNMCIVGHNYKNTKFFSKLHNIKKGAIVEITDKSGRTLQYKVYDTYIADPYDTKCTSQLTNGNIEITLITCYNNGKQRFIVKARV